MSWIVQQTTATTICATCCNIQN